MDRSNTFQDAYRRLRSVASAGVDRLGPRTRRFIRFLQRYFAVLFGRSEPWSRRIKYAVAGAGACGVALFAAILAYAVLLIPFTPGIGTLQKSKVERPSVVLSADGEVITRFRRVNREWVPLEDVSEHVVHALIATEDHRFYRHPGVDPIRILGAIAATVGGDRQGGSTITQQLARNMFPDGIGRSVTLTRKLKEMITAFKIEIAYQKDEILEAYLNTVPFFFGAYGIEMAARTYFGKSADNLNVVESATLVGMLKGTFYYNPVRNPERALQRRNVALQQMVRRGYLEQSEFERLSEGPIRLQFERQEEAESQAPHFTEHLRLWLADWADRRDYNIYRDSLVIHTTLDAGVQEMANRAVRRQGDALQAVADVEWGRSSSDLVARDPSRYVGFRRSVNAFDHFWSSRRDVVQSFIRSTGAYRKAVEAGRDGDEVLDSLFSSPSFMDSLRAEKTRLQAGFVAIDPATGHVKAWVGSRGFDDDQYDHVGRARRQPGSTFKPFVYARALQEGYAPADKLEDREVEIPLEGGYVWKPQNAGETVSGRELTLAEGLVYSKNTITAQLVNDVGPRDVARLARRMGVNRSELRAVPSLALGTSEVSLLEMVSAYGTLANLGVFHEPVLVTHIEDREGRILAEFDSGGRRVLPERTSSAVIDMMRGVVDRGTGGRIRSTFGIRADVAGKTGTTQNGADGWFILMHPRLVAGSWVGFNDPRVTFRSDYWGQGGNNALFIVGDFFRQVLNSSELEGVEASFPPAPEYDEKPNIVVRAARWVRDVFVSAWEALFGGPERSDEPRQTDTYIAQRESGSVEIDADDDSESMADSLNRMERRSNRLDSLIRLLPGGRTDGGAVSDTAQVAADTSSAAAPDAAGSELPDQPDDDPGTSTDADGEADGDAAAGEGGEGGEGAAQGEDEQGAGGENGGADDGPEQDDGAQAGDDGDQDDGRVGG